MKHTNTHLITSHSSLYSLEFPMALKNRSSSLRTFELKSQNSGLYCFRMTSFKVGAVRFRYSWSSWALKLSWHIMYKASWQLAYSVVKFTIFIPLLLQWLVSAVSLTAFSLAIRQAWFHQTLLKYNMQQRSLAREQVTDIHQKSTFAKKQIWWKK